MTQEDKELLIKDLCKRLPYGVVIQTWYDKRINIKCVGVNVYTNVVELDIPEDDEAKVFIDNVKPYLFPLSTMTEEMIEELNAYGFFKYRDTITNVSHLISNNGINEEIYTYIDIECVSFLIEFFNSHHIDYRGLIEKGLAIDATNKNIY